MSDPRPHKLGVRYVNETGGNNLDLPSYQFTDIIDKGEMSFMNPEEIVDAVAGYEDKEDVVEEYHPGYGVANIKGFPEYDGPMVHQLMTNGMYGLRFESLRGLQGTELSRKLSEH